MMPDTTVGMIRETAVQLTRAARAFGAADPGASAFGAGALGLLGTVGREAHQRWQAALDARGREAAAHATRLRDFADLVQRSVQGLAAADEEARREAEAADAEGVG